MGFGLWDVQSLVAQFILGNFQLNSLPKKASVEKLVLHLVSQSLGFVSVVTDVLLKLVPPKYVTKKMLAHLQGDISDIYKVSSR